MTEYEDADDMPISNGMSDDELCALIDRESSNAVGYSDTMSDARRKGMEYYLGEPAGNLAIPDVDGRSGVVSKDLMDVVEWIMPSAMRLFTGTDEVARFEPDGPEDEKGAEDATRLVQHVIMEKNDGFRLLHDAIKNSLIQRMGVVKVYCEQSSEVKQERYEGLSESDMTVLSQDQDVKIIEATPNEYDQTTVDVVVERTNTKKEYRIEGVPPEEFAYSRECKDITKARYVEHKVQRTRSELRSAGYPAAQIDDIGSDDNLNTFGGEAQSRQVLTDGTFFDRNGSADDSEEQLTLTEAYIRCDFDGDGISEYRRVVKVGQTILENEVTDDHPFALFTPVLMPYLPVGLSMYDFVQDLQDIKTALTRQMLDSAYLANNPRTEVVEADVNMDDLLNPRVGGVVRTKRLGSMREIVTPFVGASGLQVIQYVNSVRDARTGVTEFNQGLAGSEMANTAIGSNGVQEIMASAVQRLELMIRVLAETGVKRLWQLTFKEISQYQDRPMQMKVNGRWLEIDPREWHNKYRCTISVGVAASSRQQQIGNLRAIAELQERAAMFGLSDPSKAFNTLSRMTEQMGFRDSDQFWTNPANAPPQEEGPPQPDPKDVLAAQLKQMDIDAQNMRNEADNQVKLAIAQMQIQSNERIAGERIKADLLTKQAFDGEIGYNPEAVDEVGI
jgi:hypothetical protein